MARLSSLNDLRGAIEDINREVMEEQGNGEASNSIVLNRLKESRPTLVKHFAPQLMDMALTKLLNDVCRQSAGRNSLDGQCDLFDGYRKIPKRVTILRGLKKDTAKLSISEAEDWLGSHAKRTVNSDYEDFSRLVAECRKYAVSDADTIEQALERKISVVGSSKHLELTD